MYAEFIDQLEQAFTASVDVMNATDWEEFMRQGDSVAYRKSSDKGTDYLKIDGLSRCSAKELCEALFTNFVQAATTTADDVEECREVKAFNESAKLIYIRNKSVGPVSSREVYLFLTTFEAEEGVYCIAGKSVDHASLEMNSDCVKAEINSLVYTFQTVGAFCRIGYLLYSGAGGSVPGFLVNAFLDERVINFTRQVQTAEASLAFTAL